MYMYKVGFTFTIPKENVRVQIVNIDTTDAEFPYECYPVSIVKEAEELSKTTGESLKEIILFSEYAEDYVEERYCLSEKDIERYLAEAGKLNAKTLRLIIVSLINAVDENLVEFEDKMNIFRESGITPEQFCALGYSDIACQLEDTEE